MSPLASERATSARNQDAVYWAPDGVNGFGQPTFADPVEIKCRWVDKQETFVDGRTGDEALSSAIVYPDQAVVLNGQLYLGTLADLNSAQTADPLTFAGAKEIKGLDNTPSRAGQTIVRKAWL